VTLDVDGSADAIAAVRCSAGAGADFVKGSRFAHGGGSSDITVGGALVIERSAVLSTDACHCLKYPGRAPPRLSPNRAHYGAGFERKPV
jgi:hypothetical protein